MIDKITCKILRVLIQISSLASLILLIPHAQPDPPSFIINTILTGLNISVGYLLKI